MNTENMRVMEALIAQCEQAFHARKPLIMVDTEETEVMERLAKDGGIVTIYRKEEESFKGNECAYYKQIGVDPEALYKAVNFFYSAEKLGEFSEKSGTLRYKGFPQLRIVHLMKEDSETRESLRELRRYVRNYVRCQDDSSKLRSSCVLLYGDPDAIPRDLVGYTEVLTVNYPSRWEIREVLIRIAKEHGVDLEPLTAKNVAELMIGFTLIQVEEYAHRLFRLDNVNGKPQMLDPEARQKVLLDAKAQAIRSTGEMLTLFRDKGTADKENARTKADLGGMRAYKQWVESAGFHMHNNERYTLDLGISSQKGVLLCGVPGCGKSEAAKILHRKWGLPMVRMDVDSLMGGLVGESERNMRQALALVEAMAPCILWIDEIEKGFSAASSGNDDGGTFKRMFGRLLTWMQENKKPCFIFATANDISQLPPEFFRSGRFDALFSVFMPTNQECKEIFREQMRRVEKLRTDTAEEWGSFQKPQPLFDKSCFEDKYLQAIVNLFTQGKDPKNPEGVKFVSGADIEKITKNAIKKLAEREVKLLPGENKGGSLTEAQWRQVVAGIGTVEISTWLNVLAEVIQDPTLITQGSGSANLDQIAACYVRLLRGNFAPASSADQQLFEKNGYSYSVQNGELVCRYDGKCKMEEAYDQALYYALKDRIERIGRQVEIGALQRFSM